MKTLILNTPQSLYWMGFLIADGYFSFRGNRIELSLSKKDEAHFDAFVSYCNLPHKEEREFNGVIHTNKVITKATLLRTYTISNRELFTDLVKKYGINKNKSETPPDLSFIRSLPDNLFCCFLIGLIDGDGWKETGGNKGSSYHVICCHKNYVDFLSYMTDRMNTILNTKSKLAHIKPTKQQAIVSFSPRKSSYLKSIIDEYALIHLNRKWDSIFPTKIESLSYQGEKNQF